MFKDFKKSFLFSQEVEYQETIYKDDIRALVLAHKLNSSMVNVEANTQIKGIFSYYYRKLAGARKVMLGIILLIILFQKPAWCVKMGDSIDETCSVDLDGRNYNLSVTLFIDPRSSFVISFGLMYFLIILQILKVQASEIVFPIEKLKLTLQIVLFSLSLILSLLEAFNFIPVSDFPNIFKLVFVIIYFKSMIQSFSKIGQMLMSSSAILLLLLIVLIIFSLLARVLFEGLDVGEDNILAGYCFKSFATAFESMFQIMFFENYPNVMVEIGQLSGFYVLFFVLFSVTTSVMLLAIITGVFYFNYKGIYITNLNKVAFKYPEFVDRIEIAMKAKFLKPEITDSLTKKFENRLREPEAVEIPENEKIRASYKAKLRRALIKIKYFNSFKKPSGGNLVKQKYLMVSQSFYYRLINFVFSFYLCMLPMVIIDENNSRNYIANLQMSEFIAGLLLIDFFVQFNYNSKVNFWNFINTVECISNFGIILTAHILYLIPADFRSNDIIGSRGIYLVWTSFCLLKFVKLQHLLMAAIKYKIIIKTILHIFPLVFDLLTCYLVILIFYSIIGYSMLGGIINSNFNAVYNQVTNSDFDLNFNFNDIFNSMLTFITTNIASSFMTNFGPGMVASMELSTNGAFQFFIKMFFYSYVLISELIVISIIVGFIIDFLNIYQENNAGRRIKEQVINNKQDFVDIMLNNKEFGDIDPDEFDEEGNLIVMEEDSEDGKKSQNNKDDQDKSDALSNDFESQHSVVQDIDA